MKKLLIAVTGLAFSALSAQAFAVLPENHIEIGQKIYERAFGRGCGTCHDQAQNPQLHKLISEGKLTKLDFEKAVKEGKNGGKMPVAITDIMQLKPVVSHKMTPEDAITSLYDYLKTQQPK